MKYFHFFETQAAHDAEYTRLSENYLEPWVAYTPQASLVTYNLPPADWSKEYLAIRAIEDGLIGHDSGCFYSTDNGESWSQLNNGSSIGVNAGDAVMFKRTAQSGGTFSSTGKIEVMGNAYSMIYGDNFIDVNDLSDRVGCLSGLFKNCYNLVSAKNLSLPAMILGEKCYDGMFYHCDSLVEPPKLPATTLAMQCYIYMFQYCSGLTTAPELPASVMADRCYYGMFRDCTSLTNAPELNSSSLNVYCYGSMFRNCTSLTTAPELPAITLVEGCYDSMFRYCSRLNYIKAMFTTEPTTAYTQNWVSGVPSSGTFVKNSVATWNVSGANGIPSGWTVQTASS